MENGSCNKEIPPALLETNLPWLGPLYRGKVRDSYKVGSSRVLVATDRLSAFDKVITTIPGKGQVLTAMASYWFGRTESIISNHVIAIPDPSVMVVREVSIVPIEVVVRGYLAGSAWRDYQAGKMISGHRLPPGLSQFEQLPCPIVTPSTKAQVGDHDVPISESEIVQRGIVTESRWEQIRSLALSLFQLASKEVESRGLLFVDTKYEFGILDEEIILADEIHTLDSSRFWVQDSYEGNISQGKPPEMLDKEPIRRWLLERGFSGDGSPPMIDDNYRVELREHYARSCERITGQPFEYECSDPHERISRNMSIYLAGKS